MKKYTDGNIFQQNMKDISLANGNIENKNLKGTQIEFEMHIF